MTPVGEFGDLGGMDLEVVLIGSGEPTARWVGVSCLCNLSGIDEGVSELRNGNGFAGLA